MLLLVFMWTFVAMTIKSPLPFSVKDAINFQNHTQSVTLVVMLIASAFQVLSTACVPKPIFFR